MTRPELPPNRTEREDPPDMLIWLLVLGIVIMALTLIFL